MSRLKVLSLILLIVLPGCAPMMGESPSPAPGIILSTPTPIATQWWDSFVNPTRTPQWWDSFDNPTRTPEPMLGDPTFDEMIRFLNRNTVNWSEYTEGYKCLDFSCDLQMEAALQGIRSAVVIILFPSGSGSHALVAFNTTDQGLIYFEPQVDHRMEVEIGRKYWSWIYWPDYDYKINYDDTVVSMRTLWDLSNLYCKYGGRD